MSDDFIPAEIKKHLKTCKECHDPAGDGGDAVFCQSAEMLFLAFRVSLHGGQSVLVH